MIIMGRKKKNRTKMIMVAGVIIAVAVLLLAVFYVPSILTTTTSSESMGTMGVQAIIISPAQINFCKTIRYTEDVWTGQNSPVASGYPYKELIDKERYTTKRGASDAVLIKGILYKVKSTPSTLPQRAYYNAYIMEKGRINTWKKIVGLNFKDSTLVSYADFTGWRASKGYSSDTGATTIWASTGSLSLKGIHSGALKVDFVVEFKNIKTSRIYERVMATDYAYLV